MASIILFTFNRRNKNCLVFTFNSHCPISHYNYRHNGRSQMVHVISVIDQPRTKACHPQERISISCTSFQVLGVSLIGCCKCEIDLIGIL